MSVPTKPSFLEVARMMNQLVPELSKNVKPLKPIFTAAKGSKEFANGLTDIGKRSKYFIEDFKFNNGQAGRITKTVQKQVVEQTKKVSGIQKITDALKKGALKEVNPRWGSVVNILSTLAFAGIQILAVKTSEQVQEIDLRNGQRNEADLQSTFTRGINNSIQIRGLQKQVTNNKQQIDKELSSQAKQIFQNTTVVREAKKQANDALYEVRQGRRIIENQIVATNKRTNDVLAESRGTATKIRQEITSVQQSIRTQITDALRGISNTSNAVSSTVQSAINSAVSRVQSDINSVRQQVNSIRPPAPVDTRAIENSVTTNIRSDNNLLKQQLDRLGSILSGVLRQQENLQTTDITLGNSIKAVAGTAASAERKADQAIQDVNKRNVFPDLVSKNDLDRKFNEIVAQNAKDLGIRDLSLSNLSKKFDADLKEFDRLSKLNNEQRFSEFIRSNEQALNTKTQQITTTVNSRITPLETKIRERETVDTRVERKIDSLVPKIDSIIPTIAGIPLIAGRAADLIRPSIPTIDQIGTATGAAMCRNLQTGCGKKAIDDAVGAVSGNNNQNTNAVLNALNTASNAADLALLPIINNKLGDQVPGGISGNLGRISKWLQLDKLLNILTFAATVHNSFQLSNDIGLTLGSALGNVLQLIGIKDENGSAIDVSQLINSTVENLVKGIVGAENYQQMSEAFAKANRIYQATTNVLNSFLNLSQTILQANELIAAYTGRIGNALKKGGIILENAYGWMNPQPKFNRVTKFLEGLQNGASTIQMVTQVPLDILNATTEFTTASTDFVKAIKEDNKPENKPQETPEPDELKAQETTNKTVSQPLSFDFSDLFDGED
ncbi:hypothetical protein [Anabaena subtropica]|uniref:Uncharacterized protein n=1 Tax=Anabaena subtropica FACHB-260 TaxID=2692884 RepID=A0ABR8CMC3_9NOST|nr:hypothetical protein [Anabaena subtropica]MBD2344169.1 hypothetical protein [Anabaena subtropica FACHB-260]